MKLAYNLLCVDDNLQTLKSERERFTSINSDMGIQVNYIDIEAKPGARDTTEKFKTDIEAKISGAFEKKVFDLILVDLHMGELSGHEVIKWIRGHSIYRPIIFYSAGDPESDSLALEQLENAAKSDGIWGRNIIITDRRKLPGTLEDLASDMHREEHKINQVRGLLTDQVSEIDARLIKIFENIWESLPIENQQAALAALKERVEETARRAGERDVECKNLEISNFLSFLTKNEKHLGTFVRAKVIREMLRNHSIYSSVGGVISDFCQSKKSNQCLIDLRNQYAHLTFDKINEAHDDMLCKYIREECRRQLSALEEILQGSANEDRNF